jgi:MFS family permease
MNLTGNNYQAVFGWASIPAIAAILILIFCVKEPPRFNHSAIAAQTPMPAPKLKPKFSFKNFKYLGTTFWILMGINAVYMTARMNETFLSIHTNIEFNIDPMLAPIVLICFNFGTALASYPIGLLGDKLNRVKLLFLGIIFLILSDIVMYSAVSKTMMYVGIGFWGIQVGVAQNLFISLIAEKVPEDLRGTGIGVYWIINAISAFAADTLAGYVAHNYASSSMFISSGLIGILSLVLLTTFINTISPSSRIRKI